MGGCTLQAMKRILFPSFLIIILMTNSALQMNEIIRFFMNREMIAPTMCTERNTPNSCCAGSCVLKEQIETVKGQNAMAKTPLDVPLENNNEWSRRMDSNL
jgi:hypothetical protein